MPRSAPQHRPSHPKPPEQRPTAAQRGYGAAWQRYRLWFLAQPEHVLCAECKREVATVVDHITPHKGDYELFHDPANHQALCIRCHNRKTARGQRG
jgi:5-methylcytosine-specific restriction enzyme A